MLSPSIRALYLNKGFCRSILCYVSERCVKDFNGSKRIKDRFFFLRFYILCPKKAMSPNFDNSSAS